MTSIDILITQWQNDHDISTRDSIVIDSISSVYHIAKKYKSNHNYGDLINEGLLGIISACDTFKVNGGANFKTYATHCAHGAMLDYIRLDRTIPVASKTMHSHNLSFHPVPEKHSEVLALAEKTGVSYESVTKYATMSNVGSTFEHVGSITGDITLNEVIAQELNERLGNVSPRNTEASRS